MSLGVAVKLIPLKEALLWHGGVFLVLRNVFQPINISPLIKLAIYQTPPQRGWKNECYNGSSYYNRASKPQNDKELFIFLVHSICSVERHAVNIIFNLFQRTIAQVEATFNARGGVWGTSEAFLRTYSHCCPFLNF